MTLTGAALFLHILAAIGIVGGSSALHYLHSRMRRAQTHELVLEWASGVKAITRLMPIFSVVILVCGIYLTLNGFSFADPWILASLILLVVIGIASPVIIEPRMKRAIAATMNGAPMAEVAHLLADPVFGIASGIFTLEGIGIVLLMAAKPDLIPTLVVVGVAALLGVILGWPRAVAVPQPAKVSASAFDNEATR